jgi:S1-C subfamily serine protease
MSSSASTLAALSDDLAEAVSHAGRSVVAINARRRIPSSGVLWRDNVIVAANHTITRDEDVSVTLPDGSTVPATLAGRDQATDLAVLRVDSPTPAVRRAGDDRLQVGRVVLAVGRPGPQVTAALGIISAVGGEWRTWHGGRIDRFVRLDLSVYDGFSGSPLVETDGGVLGINTSGLSRASALTIPTATVDRVVAELIERGHIARGYLGLAVQPVRLPDAMRQSLSVSGAVGLVVINLETNGPAERAGLLLGDILIGLDGREVSDPSDLLALLASARAGAEVALRIVRAGAVQQVTVSVGERPSRKARRS